MHFFEVSLSLVKVAPIFSNATTVPFNLLPGTVNELT
jgi:hypothetical protein